MKPLLGIAVLSAALAAPAMEAQRFELSLEYGARPSGADLFDRVQYDLDRAARNSYPNGRLQRAQHELGEFRARYNSGRSARRQLDGAIAAVRDLAGSDVLRPRDRDTLQNDLISMRQFRERSRDYRSALYN